MPNNWFIVYVKKTLHFLWSWTVPVEYVFHILLYLHVILSCKYRIQDRFLVIKWCRKWYCVLKKKHHIKKCTPNWNLTENHRCPRRWWLKTFIDIHGIIWTLLYNHVLLFTSSGISFHPFLHIILHKYLCGTNNKSHTE